MVGVSRLSDAADRGHNSSLAIVMSGMSGKSHRLLAILRGPGLAESAAGLKGSMRGFVGQEDTVGRANRGPARLSGRGDRCHQIRWLTMRKCPRFWYLRRMQKGAAGLNFGGESDRL